MTDGIQMQLFRSLNWCWPHTLKGNQGKPGGFEVVIIIHMHKNWRSSLVQQVLRNERVWLAHTSKVFTCNLLKRLKMKYEGIIEEEQADSFSPLQQARRTIEHLFWLKVITEKLFNILEQNSSCILVSLTSNKKLIY